MKIYSTEHTYIVLSAINKIENYVKCTYGPAGKGILVDNGIYQSVIDDGFLVLEELEFENEMENAVLSFVKESSRQTNKKAGDATTTSILIMCALVRGAFGNLDYKVNVDFTALGQELIAALPKAVATIRKGHKKITTEAELEAIALNAYKNPEIAKMIAHIVHTIGHEGKIEITESDTHETTFEIVTGMSLDKGYASPQMTDMGKDIVLKNPYVLVTDEDLVSWTQVKPVIETLLSNEIRSVLIIADGISGDALNGLIVNGITAIRASGFAEQRLEILKDIAVLTGGVLLSKHENKPLSSFTTAHLGKAEKIVVGMEETNIIGGAGTKEDIKKRADAIKINIKLATPRDTEKIEERVAKLTGGISVIKVGAYTDTQLRSMKLKIDDAIHATQLAKKGGKVKGGGIGLQVKTDSELLTKALCHPSEILIENGKKYLGDVFDATEVVVIAVESAVSVATDLIVSGGIITYTKEKDE